MTAEREEQAERAPQADWVDRLPRARLPEPAAREAAAGIVYKGAKPSVQATIATGTPGAKGIGGVPGTNDGIEGVKAETVLLP